MKFDSTPYFYEYASKENVNKIVEDLCSIYGGMLCGEQNHLQRKISELASLPIFRGYEETGGNKHWIDAYKLEGDGVYTSSELSSKLKGQTVRLDMLAKNNYGKEYTRHLLVGIKELFYYKRNVDGVLDDYIEVDVGTIGKEAEEGERI